MKLLRAIRLDPSDSFVYDRAAEPGEILVAGSFAFWNDDTAALAGKRRSAFRGGFLGVRSGGFSTLAQVCLVTQAESDAACAALADLLLRDFGAPERDVALAAAAEELAASAALADHAPDTLIAMHRSVNEAGEIAEQFRTLHRRADTDLGLDPKHHRAFTFFESDEAKPERVDFARMLKDGGDA